MLFMLKWTEKPQGSPASYDELQKRILTLFSQWEVGPEIKIHQFVTKVGTISGYMIVETDDVAGLHRIATIYSTFAVEIEPVIEVTMAAKPKKKKKRTATPGSSIASASCDLEDLCVWATKTATQLKKWHTEYLKLYTAVAALEQSVLCGTAGIAPSITTCLAGPFGGPEKSGTPPPPPFP